MIGRIRRSAGVRSAARPTFPFARGLLFCGLPIDGSRLYDVGPYGLHGTPNGAPTRVMGTLAYASMHVSGNSQFYSLGSNDVLNPRTAMTILMFMRLTLGGNNSGSIFTRDMISQRAYTLDHSSGNFRYYVNGGGAVGTNQLTGASTVTTDPVVVVATFDDNSDTARLWLNGRVDASSTAFTATIPASTADTRVAARQYTGFENYDDAEIYMACLWNRALTDSEILKLSRNPWLLFERPAVIPAFQISAGVSTTVSGNGRARGGSTYTKISASSIVARDRADAETTQNKIRAFALAGRDRARETEATLKISTRAIVGRTDPAGTRTTSKISARSITARLRARGNPSTTTISPYTNVARGRLRAVVSAGPFAGGTVTTTVAGRDRARGAATVLTVRLGATVGRDLTRGARTSAATRSGSAQGRSKPRGARSYARTSFGALTGRIRARSAESGLTIRARSVAGRLRVRSANAKTITYPTPDPRFVARARARFFTVQYDATRSTSRRKALTMRKYFDPKDVQENVNLTFDFAPILQALTISAISAVIVTTDAGTDASPSSILNGSAVIGPGAQHVLVPVTGGVAGCDYRIEVRVSISGSLLVLVAFLPVREA